MKIFKSLSFKITFAIVLISTLVLVFIVFLSTSVAQNEFKTATVRLVNENGDIIVVQPVPGPGRLEEIRRDFNERFLETVVVAGTIGIGFSIVTGLILSQIITKPFEKLREGISNLKSNKYKQKIEVTGEEEIDRVINEFNELTEELQFQEELRSDLISDVSHELKTPITSIIGQIQGVKDKVLELDEQRLELIQHEAQRINLMVKSLNEYTNLRSKVFKIEKIDINFLNFCNSIKSKFEPRLKDKNISLELEIPSELNINADPKLIEEVLENLIDNAIKYSNANEIKITADSKHISISDNGVGIPNEDLKKIFERFYRVEKSRNRSTGGLGLGLSLVREMVEAHGWEIEAKNLEKGIQFGINF